ncbi:MAG TPA: ABC-ATPase domain-containing protein [Acidobacteriota bacterium]|nr:ABC-ATPase domain-containing protein [Acidobacteriota bacterium]
MTENRLRQILQRIDGRGYKAYKDIEGGFDFGDFTLSIDHVQGDPFASPSRLRVFLPDSVAHFPGQFTAPGYRRVAVGDFLSRAFHRAVNQHSKRRRGTGRSGEIHIDSGGQEVLERSSILFNSDGVEARFYAGLPAAGRRVLGRHAEEMLCSEIPKIVSDSLMFRNISSEELSCHVRVVEDQEALRGQLKEKALVTFIGNASILPRRSGVDDRPLRPDQSHVVVPFQTPPELEVELELPGSGPIRGMGIPEGVTLIVGGGYHGKSTLLRAIERGVYNHLPGDGREVTVTVTSAAKIRAEDGRYVEKVDISPFIDNLPYGRDTKRFSTDNASGSTSQAANIMEALEVGSGLLLIDEDTSATNFIIRDARMQALVEKSKEPITPFLDRVENLKEECGISTILVMGGSGDYFDVADQVIMMDSYMPSCVTEKAKAVVAAFPTHRRVERTGGFGGVGNRRPLKGGFDAGRGRRDVKIDAKGLGIILYGVNNIDLSALEQLVDTSQTRAIGEAIHFFARNCASKRMSIDEGLRFLDQELNRKGLDILKPFKVGNLARPRIQEIASAINRLRTMKVE